MRQHVAGASARRHGLAVALTLALQAPPVLAGDAATSDESRPLLSRTTIEVPLVTRHFPSRESFNDNNWGVFVDVALDRHWSVAAGHFRNSYGRNTLFAGVAYLPIRLD